MMTRRRWFWTITISLLGFVAATPAFFLATDTGTRQGLSWLSPYLPIEMDGVSGNLAHGLQVDQLRYDDAATQLSIQSLAIKLSLWDLLSRSELHINYLRSTRIELALKNSEDTPDPAPPKLPKLPIGIQLDTLQINELVTLEQRFSIELSDVRYDYQTLVLTNLTLTHPQAQLSLAGNLDTTADRPLTVDLSGHWLSGPHSGSWMLQGALNNLALTHHLAATPNYPAIDTTGHIEALKQPPEFDIDNQLAPLSIPATLSPEIDLQAASVRVAGHANHININVVAELAYQHRDSLVVNLSGHVIDTQRWQGMLNTRFRNIALETPVNAQWQSDLSNWSVSAESIALYFDTLASTGRLTLSGDDQMNLAGQLTLANAADHIDLNAQFNADQYIDADFSAGITDGAIYANVLGIDDLVIINLLLQGDITGSLSAPEIDSQLTLAHMRFRENRVDNAEMAINYKSEQSALSAQIGALSAAGSDWQNIHLSLNGSQNAAQGRVGGVTILPNGKTWQVPNTDISIENQSESWLLTIDSDNDSQPRFASEIHLSKDVSKDSDPQLSGIYTLTLNDFSLLKEIAPQLKRLDGSVELNGTLEGTASKPTVAAQLAVTDGQFRWIDPDLVFNDISVQAELTSDLHFQATGQAQQQKKDALTFTATGSLPSLTLSSSIIGSDIRADSPEFTIYASPTLNLERTIDTTKLNGTIVIQHSEFRPQQLPNDRLQASKDVNVVGRQETAPETNDSTDQQDIDITVQLADDVHIVAAGLRTRIAGQINFRQKPKHAASLQGKIDLLDGSLFAQGQALKIARGSLSFSGPADNPYVDVTAIRTINDSLEVGVHLYGPAKQLKTELYSSPALPQSSVLAYLVLGHDIKTESGDSQQDQLAGAALALGISQSSGLMRDLQRSLKLDDFAATTTDDGSAAIVAGKYLSPKLYMRYTYDVATAIGGILLRFTLSDRWHLEASKAADTTGVDVLYRLDD